MTPIGVRNAAKMASWRFAGRTSRFNATLGLAGDTRLYPYNLEVVIPFERAGPRGHDGASAPGTEEKVIAVVAGRAFLAGVLTSRDDLRFEFYTGSLKWTAKLESQLRAATGVATLCVSYHRDADWSVYRKLQEGPQDDLKFLVLAFLSPTTIVPWVMVKDAYGPAWSSGELAVLGILFAAFLLPDTYLRSFPGHPALIPGARAAAVSAALFFPLLALTRVPAWAGLTTSVLAGAVLVAGVRVARSSTGRVIARRALGGAVRSSSAPVLRDERLR